ncbi:Helix-turn-helix domain protein [Planctomycetes bacterium Pla163]|uniref:Helix-turn-helix domain protein n=1 Tax=Rohdeia mirabilis TaxID=2528008 RepID=A0A518CXV5_9BACT|nr:Helix-turn-helix domain protein [Planctomycetes bacterium Pla163]
MSELREKLDAVVARGSQRVRSGEPVTVDADVAHDVATRGHTGAVGEPIRSLATSLQAASVALQQAAEHLQVHLAAGSETSLYASVDQRDAQPQLEPLLTVKDVAHLLSVTEKTVREWKAKGDLPEPFELGGVIRWERAEVLDWLDSRRVAR